MFGTVTGWLLGVALGMRHALDPDHLTAISTLVAEGKSVRGTAWLGVVWGIGHTLALLAVGSVLALLHAEMPPGLNTAFELAVAVLLIALGVRSIARAFRADPLLARPHTHPHPAHSPFAMRSLVIGVVHGLAGSGALTALVLAELPTTAARLGYMALFGIGSVAGMALLSGTAGFPMAKLARKPGPRRVLALATGALSLGFGLWWLTAA